DASGTLRLALGRGAAWGDFDNDGYEDIIVGAERAPFCLFRNRGDGTFQDVADKMGLTDPVGLGCYAAQFIDYCNDGFQDIFLTSNGCGGGVLHYLFHNECGKRAGLTQKARWIYLTWGDYDADGRQDLLATSYDAGPFLFRNLGNGHFEDVSVRAGIRTQIAAYTPVFLDYDNDGNLDLFVCTYPGGDLTVKDMIEAKMRSAAVPAQRQLLFRNNGDGTFRNVTEETR